MDKEKALKYLYRLISEREYLEQTLRDKLYKKGAHKNVVEESLTRLKELGYLDDKNFIKSFILSKIKKFDGPNKIKNKLFILGANSNDVDLFLEELYTNEKIKENIKDLLIKKSQKTLDKDKVIAYCSRRGFSISDIINVESELNQEN
jgi:regulatory protein